MCLVRTHFRFFVFIRLFKNSICNLFYSMSAHLVVIVVVVGEGEGEGLQYSSSFTRGIFLGAGGGECGREETGEGVGESSRSYWALAAAAAL